MLPGKFDLTLYRGDSYKWQFVLWADAGASVPVDLTNATVKSEIRDDFGGAVVVPLACVVTLPNTVEVTLASSLWASMPTSGVWDLQVTYTTPPNWVRTAVAGAVSTFEDVTDSMAAVTAVRRNQRPMPPVRPSQLVRS